MAFSPADLTGTPPHEHDHAGPAPAFDWERPAPQPAWRSWLATREIAVLWRAPAGRPLVLLCAALVLLTIVGLAVLWPGHRDHGAAAFAGGTLPATVIRTAIVPCAPPSSQGCVRADVTLRKGPDRGTLQPITLGPVATAAKLDAGERVRVLPTPQGLASDGERYGFSDADRTTPILWLGGLFAVLVLLLARWRGLLALVGFALSLGLITQFLVPAMLQGSAPLLVALVCALAVMWVTVGLTYGLHPSSLAAALGIAAALALAAGLGELWVHLAHLDGHSSELSGLLAYQHDDVDLQGVVLAGIVIGALGVLADTGITQASAVLALRQADPDLGTGALYRSALRVGRDHLTATIHTLVLAYVGAALPLVLVLSDAYAHAGDAVNSQDLAEPIVATLVGAIALLVSVPLTTGLAAALVAKVPGRALGAVHAHTH